MSDPRVAACQSVSLNSIGVLLARIGNLSLSRHNGRRRRERAASFYEDAVVVVVVVNLLVSMRVIKLTKSSGAVTEAGL